MIFTLDHFNILSSEDFTWNNRPTENEFPFGMIEDSDLRCKNYRSHRDLEKRVYDDACDVGFVVKSERTDTHVLYVHWRELMNPRESGEVQVWIYRAIKQWDATRQRWVNPLTTTEIHILND